MSSDRFTSDSLKALNLTWNEKEQAYVKINHPLNATSNSTTKIKDVLPKEFSVAEQPTKLSLPKDFVKIKEIHWKISLKLFGEPMPKQSVRSYATGRRNKNGILIVDHFQPQKTVDRTKDYIKQIKEQLPAEFKIFEKQVHVTKMHFIFPPLKSFSKDKMNRIESGELIYKTTKPDLPDNLKKLVNDSLSGLVYKDDSIIVSEDNVKKYYGTGGIVLIDLQGY